MNKPTPQEFINQVTDDQLRSNMIITIALAGAPVVMLKGVLMLLFFPQAQPDPDAASGFFDTLTYMAIIAGIVVHFLSKTMFTRIFKGADTGSVESIMNSYKAANIVRFGFLEGATFLGLIGLFLCVIEGALLTETMYWLNLLPLVILLFNAMVYFPTRNNIKTAYHETLYS